MKTKTVFILCLFLSIGLTRISAQPPIPPANKNGTGTVESWLPWPYYAVPVYSPSGDLIDWLAGTVTYHNLDYFKNGVWTWRKQTYSGEVESVGLDWNGGTGEVFKVKDVWTFDLFTGIGPGHCNAQGDKGSHYIISYIWDYGTGAYKFDRAVWPGYKISK